MPNRFRQVEVQYREWQKRKETDLKIEALRDTLEALAIRASDSDTSFDGTAQMYCDDLAAIGCELAELKEEGNR